MAKKLTYEEVKAEVEKHGYELLSEEYANSKSAIYCMDKNGYYLRFTYYSLTCDRKPSPFSKNNIYAISNINRWLNKNNLEYILLSKSYEGSSKKLKFVCNKHGSFEMTWNNIHSGKRCPMCSRNSQISAQSFDLHVVVENIKLINPKIEVLSGNYINAKSMLECKCLIDSNIWYTNYDRIKQGKGCPKCAGRDLITIAKMKETIYKINPNIEIITNKDTGKTLKIECRCKICNHTFKSTYNRLRKYDCQICAYENNKGCNHWNYKNGISSISEYIRIRLKKWKVHSLIEQRYTCQLTGKTGGELNVHHSYSFNLILQETLEQTNLPLHSEIGKYTQEELKLLEDTCLELHYKYGLGVCLTKEVHDHFHKIYGRGDNTPEQLVEFGLKYYNVDLSGKVKLQID